MAYRKTWLHDYQRKIGGQLRRPDLGVPRPPKEMDEQITLAAFLDRIGVLWCHVPNGKPASSRATAGMFKAQGLKRGVPDNLIFNAPPDGLAMIEGIGGAARTRLLASFTPWRGGDVREMGAAQILPLPPARGVAIELKRRDGRLSDIAPEQMAWGEELAKRGWYWFVARGAGEAIDELVRLGYSKF